MSDEFQEPSGQTQEPVASGVEAPSGAGKLLAGFGYLVGIVALIAILIEPYKNEPFVRHHAVQALGLWVVSIVLSVISGIPIVGWILGIVVGLAVFVFAIIGCINAFQGKYYEIPLLYGVVKQYI